MNTFLAFYTIVAAVALQVQAGYRLVGKFDCASTTGHLVTNSDDSILTSDQCFQGCGQLSQAYVWAEYTPLTGHCMCLHQTDCKFEPSKFAVLYLRDGLAMAQIIANDAEDQAGYKLVGKYDCASTKAHVVTNSDDSTVTGDQCYAGCDKLSTAYVWAEYTPLTGHCMCLHQTDCKFAPSKFAVLYVRDGLTMAQSRR